MKNQNSNPNGAGPVSTAVESALARTKPSPHPHSDTHVFERDRIGGAPVRQFNHDAMTVNGRRPEFNRRQFIEWIQSHEIPESFAAAWPDLRRQAAEDFPDSAHLFPETPDGLRSVTMGALATLDELETLRRIETQVAETTAAMAEFSLSNITARHHAMRDAQAVAIREGKVEAVGLLPTREQVTADSLARLTAYNAQMVDLTHKELVPLARTILERFDAMTVEFMRKTEVRDREACAIMGMEYHPSLEWKCAAQVAIEFHADNRLPNSPSATATPRQLLGDLIDL